METLKIYRTDIDGIRAIAVLSVILFHLGYMENGYLGVDVFFVISGYLITGIIYREITENRFSIKNFYERRIRRIIPLLLFITIVAFLLGLWLMLPDDLENLSQSVFASDLSLNNILMYITSKDYWAVKNAYKPLIHTWSLSVEEQYYLLYPFMFFILKKKNKQYFLPLLFLLSLLSLFAFILKDNPSEKFYFIQYRFFELATGGIAVVYFKDKIWQGHSNSRFLLYSLIILLILILFFPILESNDLKVILITIITALILIFGNSHFLSDKIYKGLLSNKMITGLGKISFSLYMWHQLVFAFARYTWFEVLTPWISLSLFVLILFLSILTYYFIETPFRNRTTFSFRKVLIILSVAFFFIVPSSLYVYMIGGIVRDVPELGLTFQPLPHTLNFFSGRDNVNIHYNAKVRAYDRPFSDSGKTKVLVIGDSFGRDFVNILLESNLPPTLEIRYFDIQRIRSDPAIAGRIDNADYLFFSIRNGIDKNFLSTIGQTFHFRSDHKKILVVGPKDFGYSNGISYHKIRTSHLDCSSYRTKIEKEVLRRNHELHMLWGEKYIDLVTLVTDPQGNVLVFTPNCKYISQDTDHLTQYGAIFFAALLHDRLYKILNLPGENG